ncbi:MAG TPA: hypothetical protein VE913_24735 [Longimicrobium sp.]|nr:hypothetical protein [Longimicrobium sp.]
MARKMKLDLNQLNITTFQTTSTTTVLSPNTGDSFPAVCSCFGSCDQFCAVE